ncbi:MAG: penicillin acylase family protein [bacterium]|nr:penicillin acylase family protein [bacterium]
MTPSQDSVQLTPRKRRWLYRSLWVLFALVIVLAIAAGATGLWLRAHLMASMAQLDGERKVDGITESVTIERDELGIPTISGKSRSNVAFALGFVHAQDRFFQMDLMRRQAAGELAVLFGQAAVDWDRTIRVHRLRSHAERTWAETDGEERKILEAYCEGVNTGLASLDEAPFEYLALRSRPATWTPEDSLLVLLAMFIELHDEDGSRDSALGLVYDLMPKAMADLLGAQGTEWDAPISGEPFVTPPLPGPEVFNHRSGVELMAAATVQSVDLEKTKEVIGSNNWAVTGQLSAHGGAILANDMHLGLSVPNTWYRTSLSWDDLKNQHGKQHITGVSLPGLPSLVVGSNGQIAWGFTNSYGDWTDLVVLEIDPSDSESYLTPDGPRRFERFTEAIEVSGSDNVLVEVEWTIWGPVIDHDHRGRRRVLCWTATTPGGLNLSYHELESAVNLDTAVEVANRLGIPPQNFVVVDHTGRIGWTIIGRIPRRYGFDGRVPTSWSDGTRGWNGWLEPSDYPKIIDPPLGRLWTANARVVGGEMLAKIGDGSYDLGARAGQIRQGLMEAETFTETDMLGIQLDDRALFLTRWRDLLLEVLDPESIAADARRGELRQLVEGWDGRAGIESVGFRMVRAFRSFLSEQVLNSLTRDLQKADDRFHFGELGQTEGIVWKLLTERPLHLLDPSYETWEEQLMAGVDVTISYFSSDGSTLSQHPWGERNTARIQHPLSQTIPMLGRWLDMPVEPLPGDSDMPRAQGPGFGASQRLAVSPGREESGYFHMPGGQSGHPLSPFYRAGHDAWAKGEPLPFLPGETQHKLVLKPTTP